MRLYYSRKQAQEFGYNYFLDVDGRWKRYTQANTCYYSDAVCMYDGKEEPEIRVNINYDDIYNLTAKAIAYHYKSQNKITYISETEIKESLDRLMIQIDKSLTDNDKQKFKELSKKYARIKQML